MLTLSIFITLLQICLRVSSQTSELLSSPHTISVQGTSKT